MARGVLTVAALLSATAGVGLAAAAIIRNPTLEGVSGGVFGGFTLALVIMGIAAWSAMALMRTPKPVDAAAGDASATAPAAPVELQSNVAQSHRR